MIGWATDLGTNTTANVIAASATVLTALGGLILAVGVLIPILRNTRKIHTIVNQRYTDQARYIIALSQQVVALGGVPLIDQSQPVPGQPDAQPGQPT